MIRQGGLYGAIGAVGHVLGCPFTCGLCVCGPVPTSSLGGTGEPVYGDNDRPRRAEADLGFWGGDLLPLEPKDRKREHFFAMIEKEGRFEVRPVILTDPLTESKLVQLFMVQGTPVPRPLNGVRGWIAVCKEEIDPKRAPKRACL